MLHFLKKIILLIPLLVGCTSATTDSTQNSLALSTPDGAGGAVQVTLDLNQTATVKLAENQGTGYTWRYVPSSNTLSIKETTVRKEDKDVVGGQVDRTWLITAAAAGTYQVSFQYSRSWEAQPLKRVDYTLTYK